MGNVFRWVAGIAYTKQAWHLNSCCVLQGWMISLSAHRLGRFGVNDNKLIRLASTLMLLQLLAKWRNKSEI